MCVTMELDHVFKKHPPARLKCEHNWETQYEHSKKQNKCHIEFPQFLHLNSYSRILVEKNPLSDSRLLRSGGNDSPYYPMVKIVCGLGSAHTL